MLTSVGRFLRKLRIDRGELLKDMAARLNVSVSFLSAVEHGKKHIPTSWNSTISQVYDLSEQQKSKFTAAIAETEDRCEIDLSEMNTRDRELALSFARDLAGIDESKKEAIRKILKRED